MAMIFSNKAAFLMKLEERVSENNKKSIGSSHPLILGSWTFSMRSISHTKV
jgi:hypothetical protein